MPVSESHVEAIEKCRGIIEQAGRDRLADISILDIGVGFPVTYLEECPRSKCSARRFGPRWGGRPPGLRTIAEPGRYLQGPPWPASPP